MIACYAHIDVLCSYFDDIKVLMDMSTMNAKLESGQYKNHLAFEADFRLMTDNAKTYEMQRSFADNKALEPAWLSDNSTLLSVLSTSRF